MASRGMCAMTNRLQTFKWNLKAQTEKGCRAHIPVVIIILMLMFQIGYLLYA